MKDAVSTGTSGSLLWDASEDYWIAGALGSEGRVIVGNGTGDKITKFQQMVLLLIPYFQKVVQH